MKRVTVRTKHFTNADGTHYDETERTEETTGNGLFEAWGAFMVFFLTFIGCVLLVRVVLPSHPQANEQAPSQIKQIIQSL